MKEDYQQQQQQQTTSNLMFCFKNLESHSYKLFMILAFIIIELISTQ